MKKVLFISNSVYNFKEGDKVSHLKKKFEGLAQGGIEPYILGFGRPACRTGRPFRKRIWGLGFKT